MSLDTGATSVELGVPVLFCHILVKKYERFYNSW